ncbi:hypothetical protein T01_8944, partial [Trichinella spiralis]
LGQSRFSMIRSYVDAFYWSPKIGIPLGTLILPAQFSSYCPLCVIRCLLIACIF